MKDEEVISHLINYNKNTTLSISVLWNFFPGVEIKIYLFSENFYFTVTYKQFFYWP